MKHLLLAGIAAIALGAATPALAQNAGAAVGGTAGGLTGGTVGFFLGGPIGAVIGGFAGAAIGAEAGVAASSVEYSANHPVDAVYLDGGIDVGYRFGDDVRIYDIDGDDRYGYLYANNRVWIVDRESREVVHSPGYVIPERSVVYIRDNPGPEIRWSGELAPGARLEGEFELGVIPDDPGYGYVYVDGRPVLVDRGTRLVVWVG